MSQRYSSSANYRVVPPQPIPESKHSTTAYAFAQHSARRLSQGFSLLSKRSQARTASEATAEEEDVTFPEELEDESLAPADGGGGRASGGSANNGLSIEGPDTILQARWEHHKPLLTLTFRDGVQLWCCQRLAALRELCYIPAPFGADILCARLLETPLQQDLQQSRPPSSAWKHAPLLAFACSFVRNETAFTTLYIYSLDLDKTVKEITVKGHIVQLLSNQHFIVLSCTSPPALHVLFNHSLSAHPASPITDLALHTQTGHPVVSLGVSRLLAYASNTTLPASKGSGVVPRPGWSQHASGGSGATHESQTTQPVELARKFSQTALSGVRAIGDFGSNYWASSRSPPPASSATYSKSAPSAGPAFAEELPSLSQTSEPVTIQVFDLVRRKRVAHFAPTGNTHTPVSLLSLSPTGSMLLVSTPHAHEFQIYQLRPSPVLASQDALAKSNVPSVWHRYRLPRGFTPAEARSADWSSDAKFVSVYTSHGTNHVFGVRPVGGAPMYPSHLQDGVVNWKSLEPLAVPIQQSAKVRSAPSSNLPSHLAAPSSVSFEVSLSMLEELQRDGPASIKDNIGSQQWHTSRPLLVFSPQDGTLALIKLDAVPEHAMSLASGASGLSSMLQRHASAPGSMTPATPSLSLQAIRKAAWPLVGSRQVKPYRPSADESAARLGPPAARFDDSRRWTAQTEVRTFNLSKNILPRSIYLSHAFVFYVFSRKFNWSLGSLKPPSRRVAVRKEVQFLGTDITGGVSPSTDGVSEPIRMAMKDRLSIEARSASPGSPSYLAPIALNGVPGKTGSGQVWPMKAVAPHLEYMQGGWERMRSDLHRRSGQQRRREAGEPSALSFEDERSTLLLEDTFAPGSEEDVPSLAQDSGSSSTRHTSEDVWSRWEQNSNSTPEDASPSAPSAVELLNRPHDIEPFVLDEDFAAHEQQQSEGLPELDVGGLSTEEQEGSLRLEAPPLISLGTSPAAPSVAATDAILASNKGEDEQTPPPVPSTSASTRKAARRKKRAA